MQKQKIETIENYVVSMTLKIDTDFLQIKTNPIFSKGLNALLNKSHTCLIFYVWYFHAQKPDKFFRDTSFAYLSLL